MIRDFTDSSKERLLSLVREVEEEKWCNLTDWIGDRWYDFEEWIGILKLKSDLSNVNKYYKKVIDKNNTTVKQIESIFANVYTVESRYGSAISEITRSCLAFNRKLSELTDKITPLLFDVYFDWTIQLKNKLEELRNKNVITDADRDEYIKLYERYNVELAVMLDKLIEKLSDEEKRNVKFIAYTADEPYRSIYLNELESYTIGNISGKDTGYFWRGNNTINVNMAEEPGNPRGPYTTYFHESGHAIDYNFKNDGTFYSITYRNSQGKSLQDVIYADVRKNLEAVVARYTTDPTMQQHLINYIMGARSVDISTLSKTEQGLLKNIQDYYGKDMNGAVNEAYCDVYGGVTNNLLLGYYGYAHRPDGDKGQTYDNYTYWYNSNGTATGSQSKELWAEFYSYKMTGNQAALDSLKEHFPDAYVFLEEMAESMV